MNNNREWSRPLSWVEAEKLGFTEYQWASIEVQRALVERLDTKIYAVTR